jgi:hypothetical protein
MAETESRCALMKIGAVSRTFAGICSASESPASINTAETYLEGIKTVAIGATARAVVDAEDYALVSLFRWHEIQTPYRDRAVMNYDGRSLSLAAFIAGTTGRVHTVNGNAFDCRKQNLRLLRDRMKPVVLIINDGAKAIEIIMDLILGDWNIGVTAWRHLEAECGAATVEIKHSQRWLRNFRFPCSREQWMQVISQASESVQEAALS